MHLLIIQLIGIWTCLGGFLAMLFLTCGCTIKTRKGWLIAYIIAGPFIWGARLGMLYIEWAESGSLGHHLRRAWEAIDR